MFNNPALDVAIGLTFIYLLYSLLATIVKEFIATLFSYRSKMLERGIEQMLDGKNIKIRWWNRILGFIGKNMLKAKTREDQKASLFAAKITDHALYKRSGDSSANFSDENPNYLHASVFSDILVDVLGNLGGGGAPSLTTNIDAAVKALSTSNPDLARILTIYLQDANGDLQKFKTLIEDWFDKSMDRVSGWYKRQANWILFFIGLVLAFAFNVNTIAIVSKLSTDKVAREALVKNASEYINANSKTQPAAVAGTKQDTLSLATAKTQLDAMQKLYKESIADTSNILGLGYGNYGLAKSSQDNAWVTFWKKVGFIFSKTFPYPSILLGFLITAFAISMGSPFWFDLLNKFVNLRVSGQKPNPKPKK